MRKKWSENDIKCGQRLATAGYPPFSSLPDLHILDNGFIINIMAIFNICIVIIIVTINITGRKPPPKLILQFCENVGGCQKYGHLLQKFLFSIL